MSLAGCRALKVFHVGIAACMLATSPPVSPASSRVESKAAGRAADKPFRVATHVVTRGRYTERLTTQGTLLADESIELQAEVAGRIAAISFVEGARVRKGALLLKLNDADLQAVRTRAIYRKELAALRERRIAQLLTQGVARREEYDTAVHELRIQEAEIALAEAQIAKTEIRAPFDGAVGLRYVSEGALVNAATRVATFQRIDRVKVDFAVPERYAARIHSGLPIAFSVAGASGQHAGVVYAVDPDIDVATRTLAARASATNIEGRLRPGSFVQVDLALDDISDAILIPAQAVVAGVNGKHVFVLESARAVRRSIEAGSRTESKVRILSGLQDGDVVITSGMQLLRDGAAAVPIDAPTVSAAKASTSRVQGS